MIRKRPHRCMNGTERTYRHKDGGLRTAKCLRRLSFYPGEAPPCPDCGSNLYWRDESAHRNKDRARETCTSVSCPILYPHSVYTYGCTRNPSLCDITGLTGRRSREVPF